MDKYLLSMVITSETEIRTHRECIALMASGTPASVNGEWALNKPVFGGVGEKEVPSLQRLKTHRVVSGTQVLRTSGSGPRWRGKECPRPWLI